MQNPCLPLLSDYEFKKCTLYFSDKSQDKNSITFPDFVSILKHMHNLNQEKVLIVLEGIKKEVKARTGETNETLITISEKEYYNYIKQIILEQHKLSNEGNSEFRRLFDLLAQGNDTITKTKIKKILEIFRIIIDEQFFITIPKKENIEFKDFCCLFKAEAN